MIYLRCIGCMLSVFFSDIGDFYLQMIILASSIMEVATKFALTLLDLTFVNVSLVICCLEINTAVKV